MARWYPALAALTVAALAAGCSSGAHPASSASAATATPAATRAAAGCATATTAVDAAQELIGAPDVPAAEAKLRDAFGSLPDGKLKVDVGVALESLDRFNLDALAGSPVDQDIKDVGNAFTTVKADCGT